MKVYQESTKNVIILVVTVTGCRVDPRYTNQMDGAIGIWKTKRLSTLPSTVSTPPNVTKDRAKTIWLSPDSLLIQTMMEADGVSSHISTHCRHAKHWQLWWCFEPFQPSSFISHTSSYKAFPHAPWFTLPKINMEPKNNGFQKTSPIPHGAIFRFHVKLWEGTYICHKFKPSMYRWICPVPWRTTRVFACCSPVIQDHKIGHLRMILQVPRFRFDHPFPIPSMGLVYLPTWMVDFYGKFTYIWLIFYAKRR